MADVLTYRLYEERDLPGVLRLWEVETDWGAITPEQWRRWYVDTPHGPCMIVVALDERGEIAGQMVFTPSRVVVGEREVRGLRISAPIIRKDLRRGALRTMRHPVVRLYFKAAELAAAEGYSVMYGLPEQAWMPFFRWLPLFVAAEYPCVAVAVAPPRRDAVGDASLAATPVTAFGAEYELLWRAARAAFPISCGVVRHADWLCFKNSGHISLEVRDMRNGALAGYAAVNKRTGLLVDILARDADELAAVLAATLAWFADQRNGAAENAHGSIKAMATPALRPALDALGFAPLDYRFAFACETIDPSIAIEEIAPERWYVTPGD